jgi:hypothetical protein
LKDYFLWFKVGRGEVRGGEEPELVALFLLLLFFWFRIVVLDTRRCGFGGRTAIGIRYGSGCGDRTVKSCEAGMQRLLKGGVWRGGSGLGERTGGGMGKEVGAAYPCALELVLLRLEYGEGRYRFASGRSNILLLLFFFLDLS